MLARIVPVTQLCVRGWASKSSLVSANLKVLFNTPRNSQLTSKLCQSQLSTSAPKSARAARGKVNVGEVKEPTAGIAAINLGRASLAGASLLGIGGLCLQLQALLLRFSGILLCFVLCQLMEWWLCLHQLLL